MVGRREGVLWEEGGCVMGEKRGCVGEEGGCVVGRSDGRGVCWGGRRVRERGGGRLRGCMMRREVVYDEKERGRRERKWCVSEGRAGRGFGR